MTPRALLTTIGVTAIGFAIAIGVATGSSTGVNTSERSPDAFAASFAHDRAGAYDWSEGEPAAGERLAFRNDSCLIAM